MSILNTKTKLLALMLALPLATVACSKKETPAQEQQPAAAEQAPVDTTVSADQQALVDSIDKPNADAIRVEGEDAAAPAEAATETAPAADAAQPSTEAAQ